MFWLELSPPLEPQGELGQWGDYPSSLPDVKSEATTCCLQECHLRKPELRESHARLLILHTKEE